MEEIVNRVAFRNRIGASVLVEGSLGWAMIADWVKVAKCGECRQKLKEMKKMNLKKLGKEKGGGGRQGKYGE